MSINGFWVTYSRRNWHLGRSWRKSGISSTLPWGLPFKITFSKRNLTCLTKWPGSILKKCFISIKKKKKVHLTTSIETKSVCLDLFLFTFHTDFSESQGALALTFWKQSRCLLLIEAAFKLLTSRNLRIQIMARDD